MVTLGTDKYTYEVVENWAKIPDGWSFKEVAAVGVDAHDNVYAFNRGAHPMLVFDRQGNFLRSWGEGVFPRAHGITASPDDTFFCTDDGDHTVRKCSLDGKVLFTLGMSGQPAPFMSGEPFNRCTHVAIDPRNGDFYVSDGYCNARVHKYTPDGKLLFSWGDSGTDPGQFNIVHNIATDSAGWVYVADRENHRIQVFDSNVGELGVAIASNAPANGVGPRISLYDTKGNVLARLGNKPEGEAPGQFIAPHGICIDSRGDIYLGEVSWTHTGSRLNPPQELRSLQKLVRQR
jgi:hypothetical protein